MATPYYGRTRFLRNIAEGLFAPLAFGTVHIYEAGSSTPKDSYTTPIGDIANTNPIVLDADGYPEGNVGIFLGTGKHKIDVKDADGISLPGYPQDNVDGTVLLIETITASSSTSVSLGTGVKSFEIEPNKSFPANAWILASYNGDPLDHYMIGQVVDYTDTTIQIDMSVFVGTGTYNDWTLALSGPPGPQGPQGLAGAGTGDMLKSENLSGLANNATARANLGLGNAAELDVGTTANKVVQLNGSAQLPAVSGALLTNLTAANLVGIVPAANLGTGTADSSTVLFGDGVFRPPSPPSSFGAIGTYLWGSAQASVGEGGTIAGSNVRSVSSSVLGGSAQTVSWTLGSTQTGTWRNMGATTGTGNTPVSQFMRIA